MARTQHQSRARQSSILSLFTLDELPIPERQASRKAVKTVQVSVITDTHLQAPLFIVKGSKENNDSVLTDEQAKLLETFEDIPIFGLDDLLLKPRWTTEEIVELHYQLLKHSLLALTGCGNAKQKREILEWIFEPDLIDTIIRNGKEVKVFTKDTMWTFAFCCRLEGCNDPDYIREYVRRLLPESCAHFH